MAELETFEDWSGGSAGAQISPSNTTFDLMVVGGVSANYTFSNEQVLEGLARSAKSAGTTFQYGRWSTPSHTRHRRRASFYVPAVPGTGTNRVIWEVKDGPNAAIAAQMRVKDSGELEIRNVTAAVDSMVCPLGVWFDVVVDLRGDAGQTWEVYVTDREATTSPDDTLTGALTATTFSESHIGGVTNATIAFVHYCGYVSALNDTTAPVPYLTPEDPEEDDDLGNAMLLRNVAGVPTEFEILRRVAGVATPFALDRKGYFDEPGGGKLSEYLVLETGCLFGAETPAADATGSSLLGLQGWEGFTGRTPDILHFYKQNGWSGAISASELAQQVRPGKMRPIMFYNSKIDTDLSWAQLTAGQGDNALAQMAVGLRNRTDRNFLTFWHEPEDDVGSRGTIAEYVSMFEHCVQVLRDEGVAAVADGGKTNIVCTFVGFRSHASKFPSIIPDPDFWDWCAWDPYAITRDRYLNNPNQWINDNEGSWDGFYAEYMANPVFALKPLMAAEWGVNHWAATAGFTDQTEEADFYDLIADELEANFPNLKALVHWHGDTIGGANRHYQVYGRPTAAAGLRRCAQAPYFNQYNYVDMPA